MITENVLKIGQNMIDHIFEILDEKKISGKFLYVSDPFVDKLYGQIVKEQLAELGRVKVEYVNNNTISYAMNLAERMIATDIDYIVGLGGGKVLDVCKYAAYISKRPFISVPTTMANDGIASPIAVLKRKDGKPKSLGCAMAVSYTHLDVYKRQLEYQRMSQAENPYGDGLASKRIVDTIIERFQKS